MLFLLHWQSAFCSTFLWCGNTLAQNLVKKVLRYSKLKFLTRVLPSLRTPRKRKKINRWRNLGPEIFCGISQVSKLFNTPKLVPQMMFTKWKLWMAENKQPTNNQAVNWIWSNLPYITLGLMRTKFVPNYVIKEYWKRYSKSRKITFCVFAASRFKDMPLHVCFR